MGRTYRRGGNEAKHSFKSSNVKRKGGSQKRNSDQYTEDYRYDRPKVKYPKKSGGFNGLT
tara:strand:+ start:217 stop:396 length:180 start_codon:yes stop_codon:yes gene_type:complete